MYFPDPLTLNVAMGRALAHGRLVNVTGVEASNVCAKSVLASCAKTRTHTPTPSTQ